MSRTILLCIAMVFPASTTTRDYFEKKTDCSEGFHRHAGHCYRYFPRQWHQQFFSAHKVCRRLHSHLVSIHNNKEQIFINSIVDENETYWIGLSDADGMADGCSEGVFCWTDGSVFHPHTAYHKWRTDEPRNAKNRDCVVVHQQFGWSMAISGCALTEMPFVCKRKACIRDFHWNGSDCLPEGQHNGVTTDYAHLIGIASCLIGLLVSSAVIACTLLYSVKSLGKCLRMTDTQQSA